MLQPINLRYNKDIAPYMKPYSLLLFTLLLFFGFFVAVSAQIGGTQNNLLVDINPSMPEPHEEVIITIESFSIDLSRSTITWIVDGEVQQKGVGSKKLRITMGSLGEKKTVIIKVVSRRDEHLEEKIIFRPALVDIMWEANTYTPPFYKGKAITSSKSSITVTAIPQLTTNGKSILSPEKLIYTWRKDRRVLGSKSGYGKQSLIIEGPVLFNFTRISVEVSSFDKSLKAKKTIFITTAEPEILFYKKHPLLGIQYEKTLSKTFTLSEDEITLRAEPYFFSKEDIRSGLEFEWSLNRKPFTTEDPQNEVTFRQTEQSGTARIGLEIININKMLQGAINNISLRFGFQDEFSF